MPGKEHGCVPGYNGNKLKYPDLSLAMMNVYQVFVVCVLKNLYKILLSHVYSLLKYNVQSWQKPLTMVSLTIAARPSATITLTTDIRSLFY